MTKENLWKNYTDEQKKVIFDFAEDYKKYLDSAKTEREFVDLTEKELEKNGFVNINEKSELKKGDKIYFKYNEENAHNAKGQHIVFFYDNFVVGGGEIK